MPLDRPAAIARPIGPTSPAHATEFVHSSSHIVGVGLKGTPPDDLRRSAGSTFPEADVPFYRVTVFSNYSPNNVAGPAAVVADGRGERVAGQARRRRDAIVDEVDRPDSSAAASSTPTRRRQPLAPPPRARLSDAVARPRRGPRRGRAGAATPRASAAAAASARGNTRSRTRTTR